MRGRSYLRPEPWQLAGSPADARWGVQATRYLYMNGQCRYCGEHAQGPASSVTAHPLALCLACGTPQCDKQRGCLVCMIGFVGRVPYGQSTACGYARCGKPAVARAPRVGRVCTHHLIQATSRGRTLRSQIDNSVRLRELGGLDWQKLTWFGPERRYAVRRWHDDGRTGWTTGQHRAGFETAGAADREAAAWNDPRTSDGWHAERVLLTDEVRAQIEDWEGRAAGRSAVARLT